MIPSRYLPLFGREGNGGHARPLVQGLLAGGDRRNVENMAEAIAGGVVRTLQKFVAQGGWNGEAVLRELRRHVVEEVGDEDAAILVDETGFPKKGTKSAGVARQYAGILGRTDNCQVGVFLDYCSSRGHTLCDRRLFLPEARAKDRERRDEAGVPGGVVFHTKPELAAEMLQQAVAVGPPFRQVAADAVYGGSPRFVETVQALGKWYVLDVSSQAPVWASPPEMRPAGWTSPPDEASRAADQTTAGHGTRRRQPGRRLAAPDRRRGVPGAADLGVRRTDGMFLGGRPARRTAGTTALPTQRRPGTRTEVPALQRPDSVPLRKLAEVGGGAAGAWSRTSRQPRESVGWTSTRPAAGPAGTTTRACPS